MAPRQEARQAATVDALMDDGIKMNFLRVQREVEKYKSAAPAAEIGKVVPLIENLEQAFADNQIDQFQIKFEELAACIVAACNGDPGFAEGAFFASIKRRLNASALVSDDVVEKIIASLISEITRFLKKEEVEGSNEREKLAYFLRMMNLKDLKAMLSAISEIPRLRKKIAAINGERNALIAGVPIIRLISEVSFAYQKFYA